MRIGFVGLGKMGLPVALAIQSRGHAVRGYDISDQRMEVAKHAALPTGPLAEIVQSAVIFVAIQTPHDPQFEGITRLPTERRDFDYTYLIAGLREVAGAIRSTHADCVIAIMSTVLPGTTDRLLAPILDGIPFVYNPSFIAMGTVAEDFLNPEFVLIGGEDTQAISRIQRFYLDTVPWVRFKVSHRVRDAELVKVAYNTFIGMKLAYANTMMEICHKTDCDVDFVLETIKSATRRLISPAYLSAGMGDGGACHPRDNIAMSWLARRVGLSYDLFEAIMLSREKQAEWLADLMCDYDLPKAIIGTAYKPGTDIETGSHALLVADILRTRGHEVHLFNFREHELREPFGHDVFEASGPFIVLIGNMGAQHLALQFPRGSIVIDPWRYMPDQEGVTVVRVGEGSSRMPVLREPQSRLDPEPRRALRQ